MKGMAYNIYCDESRVENLDSQKLIIGALVLPRARKKVIINDIKRIFENNDFSYELKWSKAGKKFDFLYKEILDYVFAMEDISYRAIVVDKKKVDFEKYHGGSLETAFYKFYYIMLKFKLQAGHDYYIFLDKKPSRDKNVIVALKKFLEFHIYKNEKNCRIKHLQSYDSQENFIIQITDFITGLIGYSVNVSGDVRSYKGEISQYLLEKLQRESFDTSSSMSEEKFNIFIWNGGNE